MENNKPLKQIRNDQVPLLTASQVSFRLQLSRSCTYHLMHTGVIPTVRIGKSRRVRAEDLEEIIKHNTFSTEYYER